MQFAAAWQRRHLNHCAPFAYPSALAYHSMHTLHFRRPRPLVPSAPRGGRTFPLPPFNSAKAPAHWGRIIRRGGRGDLGLAVRALEAIRLRSRLLDRLRFLGRRIVVDVTDAEGAEELVDALLGLRKVRLFGGLGRWRRRVWVWLPRRRFWAWLPRRRVSVLPRRRVFATHPSAWTTTGDTWLCETAPICANALRQS